MPPVVGSAATANFRRAPHRLPRCRSPYDRTPLHSQHDVSPNIVSDHYIIFGARKKFKTKTSKTKLWARKYKNLDENKLIQDLNNANWVNVQENQDPSAAWDELLFIFNTILDLHAPFKSMSFDDDLPIWSTRELLAEIKHRNNLTSKANRTKNENDIYLAKRKRNYISGLKRNFKKTYFRRAIEEHRHDPTELWRILRLLVGSGKSKTRIMTLNGKPSNEDMSNELKKFFAEVGPNLAYKIPESLLEHDYSFDNSRLTFKFNPISVDDVKLEIGCIFIQMLSTCVFQTTLKFIPADTSVISDCVQVLSLQTFFCAAGLASQQQVAI